MGISYKKLWKLLIDKNMSKAELREQAGVSASTISRMNKDEFVALEVICKICRVLNCSFDEVMERIGE